MNKINKICSSIQNHFGKHTDRAIKQDSSPHSIAMGFAIGSFIAIFPTFFLGLLIVLLVMLFYKNMNKIAAIAGLAFWNFVMMLPIYWLSYTLGKFFFGATNQIKISTLSSEFISILRTAPFSFHNFVVFFDKNYLFIEQYLLGNFILATFFSILSYYAIKKAVIIYQKKSLKGATQAQT